MRQKTREKYERLIKDGYRLKEKTCTVCGVTIGLRNGVSDGASKGRIIIRNKCEICNKREPQVIIESKKEALRLLRKLYGVEDWYDDDGRPCFFG